MVCLALADTLVRWTVLNCPHVHYCPTQDWTLGCPVRPLPCRHYSFKKGALLLAWIFSDETFRKPYISVTLLLKSYVWKSEMLCESSKSVIVIWRAISGRVGRLCPRPALMSAYCESWFPIGCMYHNKLYFSTLQSRYLSPSPKNGPLSFVTTSLAFDYKSLKKLLKLETRCLPLDWSSPV